MLPDLIPYHILAAVDLEGPVEPAIRVFGPHTLVGEIGFFLRATRTATVRIESEATVWTLSQNTYQEMKKSEPGLAAALLIYTVQLRAERLSFSTRQIAALQR
jgi:SulP family sulfate permease